MLIPVNQLLSLLPPDYPEDLLASIRDEFRKSGKTIVVFDDDPTGTQTSQGVTVLMSWRVELVAEELKKKPSILFILTNSRSLSEKEAVALAEEIGANVKLAVQESGQEIVLVSRSDSTLRGHYPAEVDALAQLMDMANAVIILVPAFVEGGRITVNDVHYLVENQTAIPVSETPFAQDIVFGYEQANLRLWIEEKTKGRIRASAVNVLSIENIRVGGPGIVSEKLMACGAGTVCIVNAVSYRDLEVVVMGLMLAEKLGKQFLCRSSATLVPIRAGMESGKPVTFPKKKSELAAGALIVVGSHVPKTTGQLNWLLKNGAYKTIEVPVSEVLKSANSMAWAIELSRKIDEWLSQGNAVVVYTSRKLEVGADDRSNLVINARVSSFLVSLMKELTVRPKFIIAKGGITASDLATDGLSAEKAFVLGAVIPGVPVWQMDAKSKFPGIRYVVFPGNVGDEMALETVYDRMS